MIQSGKPYTLTLVHESWRHFGHDTFDFIFGRLQFRNSAYRHLDGGYSWDISGTPRVKEVRLSLQNAVKAHRVVRCRGSHIFYRIGSQMAVRLSALRTGSPLTTGIFLVLIFVRGRVDPRTIMWLEGRDKLKKKIHLIWTLTDDLPACSIVPQPFTPPRAPCKARELLKIGIFDYCSLFMDSN
jgi:hypothetical protein